MPGRQKLRSDETKQAILSAAGELFRERGFDAVTMREIAKAADCSHTTIYIYFKDKEALLHQLAMGPLQSLQAEMESILLEQGSQDVLKRLGQAFIRFGLLHRNVYRVLFMTQATRVDAVEADLEVNKLRNHLFALLQHAVQEAYQLEGSDGRCLAYARIYFFTLHGIIDLYIQAEPFDQLMERLAPTFDLALDVMLTGFQHTNIAGADRT